jgi:hypothetical protein
MPPRSLVAIAFCLMLASISGCEMMANTKLEQAVTKALANDARTKTFDFEVSVNAPGEVLITGEVFTPGDIDAVTEIAKAVPGVKAVQNNCKIPDESSGMMQDTVVPGVGGGLAF